ncbi:class I SAM-dependent methyltransferase [Actinocorallia longicatena]|uniref:Uncharacterized protein n=1 Tax=Actinocorallia longicatena TaxID=111803 RepID=A0ABP6QHU1_9ACTN
MTSLITGHPGLAVDRRSLMTDAWDLYAHASLPLRVKQRLRPAGSGMELIFPHVPVGARVLDIGCGSGLLLGLLAKQDRQITGVGFDPSKGAIGLAQEMAGHAVETGSTLSFERRDSREEWPQGAFDVVTMVDVIHHIPVAAQREVFDKACQAVRPGGVFVYKDMGLEPFWRATACRLHDVVIARDWIHPIPVATVEAWAAEHGLVVESGELALRALYVNEIRVFRKIGASA